MNRLTALVFLLVLGASCKRGDESADVAFPAAPAVPVMNGVAVRWMLPPDFAPGRYDAKADAIVFEGNMQTLTVRARKFKRSGQAGTDKDSAEEALQSVCPQPPCEIGPLKAGYWQSHYDLVAGDENVLRWDIAAFPASDRMIVAQIDLAPFTAQSHKAVETALPSLELTLVGD